MNSQADVRPVREIFNTVVGEFRADYPEDTKNTTFVDAFSPAALGQLTEWLESTSADYHRFALITDPAAMAVRLLRTKFFERHNGGFSTLDSSSGKNLLILNTKFPPEINAQTALRRTIAHEGGHLIVQGGMEQWLLDMADRKTLDKVELLAQAYAAETVADSFSMKRGFKQGFFDKDYAAQISLRRALNAWRKNDITHATSPAIDALLVETGTQDMNPQEVKDGAARHAQRFMISGEELVQARELFRKASVRKGGEIDAAALEKLARARDAAPAGSLGVYLAAKILAAGPSLSAAAI